MSNKPIPESEWVWQGHAAHFCGAHSCRFHLATRVGAYLISTVGDYFPYPGDARERIGAGDDDYFETYAFPAGETLDCGCTELASLTETVGVRYATAGAAQAGHLTLCRQYAGISGESERRQQTGK